MKRLVVAPLALLCATALGACADAGASTAETDRGIAISAASAALAGQDARIASATFTSRAGTVTSGTEHPCLSGRLLTVRLIGEFPHLGASPAPGDSSTVTGITLTVDAGTGVTCAEGVSTTPQQPAADAVSFTAHVPGTTWVTG